MTFLSNEDLAHRLATRLDPLDAVFAAHAPTLKPAAVLAGIIRRPEGWTMLLTLRTADMPTHAGQISFPGGRIQPIDSNAVAAALRETEEETGLAREFVRPIGLIDAYETNSGFLIHPVVAYIEPGFTLAPDPREVAEAFETPVAFLLDPANHELHERMFEGLARAYYAMPFEQRYIWGATAGMIKTLYDRLYGGG